MSLFKIWIDELNTIPLSDMTERNQRAFQLATGLLCRLSDRVHMLEIDQYRTAAKITTLKEENARLRAELGKIRRLTD